MTETIKKNLENPESSNSYKTDLKNLHKEVIESQEFKYMKEATEQFDLLKQKLDKLWLTSYTKEKLLSKISKSFYEGENTEQKVKVINKLNDFLDWVIENKDNLSWKAIKKKFSEYDEESFLSSGQEKYFTWAKAAWRTFIAAIIVALVAEGTVAGIAAGTAVASLVGLIVSFRMGVVDLNDEKEKNQFFDLINDYFPDIDEKTFNELLKVYDNNHFDMEKFVKLVDKFKEDGKITEEERKLLIQAMWDN